MVILKDPKCLLEECNVFHNSFIEEKFMDANDTFLNVIVLREKML